MALTDLPCLKHENITSMANQCNDNIELFKKEAIKMLFFV